MPLVEPYEWCNLNIKSVLLREDIGTARKALLSCTFVSGYSIGTLLIIKSLYTLIRTPSFCSLPENISKIIIIIIIIIIIKE